MSITRRRPLPYSKNFVFEDDIRMAVVYFGPQAWTARDKINSRSVILPPDDPVEDYDWRFLRGHTVFCYAIGHTEKNYRRRMALEMLLAGAAEVFVQLPKIPVILCDGTNYAVALDDYITPTESYVKSKKR